VNVDPPLLGPMVFLYASPAGKRDPERLPLLRVYPSTHETVNWMLTARESPLEIVITGRVSNGVGQYVDSGPHMSSNVKAKPPPGAA
jgi:hypothetical protein